MKKSSKLPANYHKLKSYERASLLTHAMSRDDQSEMDALLDTCPTRAKPFRRFALLLNVFFTIASEYVVDQLNRAARLCYFKSASGELASMLPTVRSIAHDFLQHQAAWRQFSHSHDIPISFPECVHPGTEITFRVAADIAQPLVLPAEQAGAQVDDRSPRQPQTVEQIIADWEQLIVRLAIRPLVPDDSTDDAVDSTYIDDLLESFAADGPEEDEQVSEDDLSF